MHWLTNHLQLNFVLYSTVRTNNNSSGRAHALMAGPRYVVQYVSTYYPTSYQLRHYYYKCSNTLLHCCRCSQDNITVMRIRAPKEMSYCVKYVAVWLRYIQDSKSCVGSGTNRTPKLRIHLKQNCWLSTALLAPLINANHHHCVMYRTTTTCSSANVE